MSEYNVIEINQYEIIVEVHGNIDFTLEYGSRKERKEGDGLDLPKSFPFQTKILYDLSCDFQSDNYEIEEFDVDTSEWYGDIPEVEIDILIDEEIEKKNNTE